MTVTVVTQAPSLGPAARAAAFNMLGPGRRWAGGGSRSGGRACAQGPGGGSSRRLAAPPPPERGVEGEGKRDLEKREHMAEKESVGPRGTAKGITSSYFSLNLPSFLYALIYIIYAHHVSILFDVVQIF